MLTLLITVQSPEHIDCTDKTMRDLDMSRIDCQGALRDMIDSICHSIPFYLGNRTIRCSLADFTDPSILHPVVLQLLSQDFRGQVRQAIDFDQALRHDGPLLERFYVLICCLAGASIAD